MRRFLALVLFCVLSTPVAAQSLTQVVQRRSAAQYTGACTDGMVGFADDTKSRYDCVGGAWVESVPAYANGTPIAWRIPIWVTSSSIGSDADLAWDGTNTLTVTNLVVSSSFTPQTTISLPGINPASSCGSDGDLGEDAVSGSAIYVCRSGAWREVWNAGMNFSLTDGSAPVLGGPDGLRFDPDSDADGTGIVSAPSLCVDADGTGCEVNIATGQTIGGRAGYQCVDFDADSTCDGWITPFGYALADGRLLGPVAIVTVAGDNHSADWTSEFVAQCAANNIPCTIHTQQANYDLDGNGTADFVGVTSGMVSDWVSKKIEIGAHSATHRYVGYDTTDGNPSFGTTGGYGLYTAGTVSVTNGSTAVTGSSTSWSATAAATFTPPYSTITIDTDADGTYSDETPYYITAITGTTGLTLETAWGGSDQSGKNYRIQETWRHGMWEVEQNISALQSVMPSNGRVLTYAYPGQVMGGDDLHALTLAANRIEVAHEYNDNSTTGIHEYANDYGSSSRPLRLANLPVYCGDDWTTGLKDWVDVAIEDRAWLQFNTHRVKADVACVPTSDANTTLTNFTALAAYLKQQQAAGKLVILTSEQAARVYRLWTGGQGQNDWNLFTNTKFHDADGLYSGYLTWPGWDRNNTTTLDTLSESGGVLTWTETDGALDPSFAQYIHLTPGTYLFSVEVETTTLTGGSASVQLFDPGDKYNDMTAVLEPIWYRDGTGFQYNGSTSPTVTTANTRRVIMAYFRVPELFNEPIGFALTATNLNGTVKWRNPTLIRRDQVALWASNVGSRWGQGNGTKRVDVSRADPADTGGNLDAAFSRVWVPQEEQLTDTPTNHHSIDAYRNAAGTLTTLTYLDVTGATTANSYLSGLHYGDPDGDGTYEQIGVMLRTETIPGNAYMGDPNMDGTTTVSESANGYAVMDGDGTDEDGTCGTNTGQCVAFEWVVPDEYLDNGIDGTNDLEINLNWSVVDDGDGTVESGNVVWVAAIRCQSDGGTLDADYSTWTAAGSNTDAALTDATCRQVMVSIATMSATTTLDAVIDNAKSCWIIIRRADSNANDTCPESAAIRSLSIVYGAAAYK